MNLTHFLKESGYDLIQGPVRNHKPLQLWLKSLSNEEELYYADVGHAFTSDVTLEIFTNDALSINASITDEFGFNIGLTFLDDILKSIGLGLLNLSSSVSSGKKVTISYDKSITKEVPVGMVENYFASADFRFPNPILLRNAERNNLLIITGVVYAKELIVRIKTEGSLAEKMEVDIKKIAEGSLEVSLENEHNIKMISKGKTHFPIAVKANRLRYYKGKFQGITLVTDSLNVF